MADEERPTPEQAELPGGCLVVFFYVVLVVGGSAIVIYAIVRFVKWAWAG